MTNTIEAVERARAALAPLFAGEPVGAWDGGTRFLRTPTVAEVVGAILPLIAPESDVKAGAGERRPYPDLLSADEQKAILADAEQLWSDLQANNLGGFSGINRPFYIVTEFKRAIEEFGRRDIGLSWSKNDLDADLSTPPAEPVGDWPTDGTCRRCGHCPRSPETGLCASCEDEITAAPQPSSTVEGDAFKVSGLGVLPEDQDDYPLPAPGRHADLREAIARVICGAMREEAHDGERWENSAGRVTNRGAVAIRATGTIIALIPDGDGLPTQPEKES